MRELKARHLQMFYSEMLRKVKPNTVIHYHAIIHSALKYAVKTDMLVQNVADKVDRPKKNSFQPVFLSAEEMQKMFEALRGTGGCLLRTSPWRGGGLEMGCHRL